MVEIQKEFLAKHGTRYRSHTREDAALLRAKVLITNVTGRRGLLKTPRD